MMNGNAVTAFLITILIALILMLIIVIIEKQPEKPRYYIEWGVR